MLFYIPVYLYQFSAVLLFLSSMWALKRFFCLSINESAFSWYAPHARSNVCAPNTEDLDLDKRDVNRLEVLLLQQDVV